VYKIIDALVNFNHALLGKKLFGMNSHGTQTIRTPVDQCITNLLNTGPSKCCVLLKRNTYESTSRLPSWAHPTTTRTNEHILPQFFCHSAKLYYCWTWSRFGHLKGVILHRIVVYAVAYVGLGFRDCQLNWSKFVIYIQSSTDQLIPLVIKYRTAHI
jgi:hypothetical protein